PIAVDDDDRRNDVREGRLGCAGRVSAGPERDGLQLQTERIAAAEAEQDVGLAADVGPDQLAQLGVLRERGPTSTVRRFELLLFRRGCGLARFAAEPAVEPAQCRR